MEYSDWKAEGIVQTKYHPLNDWADDICMECGHRRGYHDGIGCNDQILNGDPCLCKVKVNLRGEEINDDNELYREFA